MTLRSKKIYVAGSGGMVGRSVVKELRRLGYLNIVERELHALDLRDQAAVRHFFAAEKPDIVIVAAARVGGILANNTYRADFIYDNLMIEANVIHAAFQNDAEKLILLGSSCIYPKLAAQPIKEEYLLQGPLEKTNEPYAIAKIAGIKLCESYYRQHQRNFYSIMPTNLYGPNDNFDPETSHVIPALIRKFHNAVRFGSGSVQVWGSGTPRREFLYVDDLAQALIFLMESTNAEDIYEKGITHINVGTGVDLSIDELAATIARLVGFDGEIHFDTTMADGTLRKLLDVTRLRELGWVYTHSLEDGLRKTIDWYERSFERTEHGLEASKT